MDWAVERGWVYATLMFGEAQVRTGYLIVGILKTKGLAAALLGISQEFKKISLHKLTSDFEEIARDSSETGLTAKDGFLAAPTSGSSALTHNEADTPDIFVCYRRDDSNHVTGRICDRLFLALGRNRVFRDIDSIPLGIRDFDEELKNKLVESRFFLAVIGKHWLDAADDEGRQRLGNADDYVSLEIGTTLKSNAQIIPIMVDEASIPAPSKLSENLRPLTRCPALPVRGGQDFENDTDRLISHLRNP